jgi:hypothetical protein
VSEVTIRSEGSFDFGTDLFAGIGIFEDDFFEAGVVFVALRYDEGERTSLRRLLNPYEVSSIGWRWFWVIKVYK